MSWNIILYESGNKKPVEDFIESLQESTIAKLMRQLDLLEEFGISLQMPHAKPIGGGLFELRVRGKEEARALYIFAKGKNIYLLHGFIKKSNAISEKDLNIAKLRQRELQ